ncbi:MAG: efflux RND transporter periplasmic adaptor subunit [Pseudomonadota bacterium]
MIPINYRSRIQWMAVAVAIIAAAVFGFGIWRAAEHHRATHGATQLYTCPMHPSYISDKPGQCPICGMTLVPVKKAEDAAPAWAPEAGGKRAAVTIDSDKQQRIGVKTAKVAKGNATAMIRASGQIAFDPDLVVAQREYIEARRAGDASLAQASEKRLTLMGMGKDQIKELAHRGRPDDNLVLPSKGAWVYASIHERDIPIVKAGQTAKIELPDGTQMGSGIIRSVDPTLDPATRTARARIEIAGDATSLKPNMFVTALIREDMGDKLLVPKSAVIDSGTRKLVFIVHGENNFMPAQVELGPELSDNYVVEKGLNEGDVVATAALFLIDSESQLTAAQSPAGGHEHD